MIGTEGTRPDLEAGWSGGSRRSEGTLFDPFDGTVPRALSLSGLKSDLQDGVEGERWPR